MSTRGVVQIGREQGGPRILGSDCTPTHSQLFALLTLDRAFFQSIKACCLSKLFSFWWSPAKHNKIKLHVFVPCALIFIPCLRQKSCNGTCNSCSGHRVIICDPCARHLWRVDTSCLFLIQLYLIDGSWWIYGYIYIRYWIYPTITVISRVNHSADAPIFWDHKHFFGSSTT